MPRRQAERDAGEDRSLELRCFLAARTDTHARHHTSTSEQSPGQSASLAHARRLVAHAAFHPDLSVRGGDEASRAERRSSRRSDQCIQESSRISIHIQVGEAARRPQGARWARRGGGRARSGGAARTGEGLRCRSEKQRPLLFPLSCTFPIPSGFPQRWRSAAGPALSAHGGRGGGRAGAAAQAQRRGGEEARRRRGATGCTRKVAHGCKQRETSIGVSGGRPLPSHGWLEASAAERSDSRAGSLRPLGSLSSSPGVLLRTAPSPHPFLAPLRVATRDDEFSASRPVGGGGAGSGHGGGGDPRLSPLPELDSAGATAQARQGGTPEHVRGAGGPAAVVLRVDDLRRGGRLQSQRRRRRWARRRWATRGLPVAAFAGSQLAPHACCGGPRVTFAVLPHCRLPPYPPMRVAPSAMPRSPARPGHPFPANLTPPVRHQQQATNTHAVIDETHVRYI